MPHSPWSSTAGLLKWRSKREALLRMVACSTIGSGVVALALLSPTFAAAAGGSVTCPSAPAGWTSSPSTPTFWGPTQNPGQDTEEVTCHYASALKRVSLVGEYALPTDINPINDFYYGCTNSHDVAWSDSTRVYIVTSKSQWGYAELNDSDNQLAPSDVSGFESATRALLANTEGFGHVCKVHTTSPVGVNSIFRFSFEFDVHSAAKGFEAFGGVSSSTDGNQSVPAGSFTTLIGANGSSNLAKVVQVQAPEIPMTIVDHGKVHTVTIRIGTGIDFLLQGATERLRANIEVVRSNYPSCRRGATGTLTISTVQILFAAGRSSIDFALCDNLFERGSRTVKADIIRS
jgi:hypothetical protein